MEEAVEVANPLAGFVMDTPLTLKSGTKGKFSIKREVMPRGKDVPVVTMRTAILMGVPHFHITLKRPTPVHQLLNARGGLVTSDTPQELYTQQLSFRDARGHVLVGGLGIGMAATMIANKPGVKSVTVVEIEKDDIDLVWKQLPKTKAPMTIVCANLFKYLAKKQKAFDYFYIDIWSGTSESDWDEYVVPLRRLIYKNYGPKTVTCWMEAEMSSQIQMSIMTILSMDIAKAKAGIDAWRPKWTFFKAMDRLPQMGPQALMQLYLQDIGSTIWEKTFPWDEWKKPKYKEVK